MLRIRTLTPTAAALAVLLCPAHAIAAQRAAPAVDTSALSRLVFRNVGPVNMMGRSTDIEGVEGDANTVYVGTAAGGVWKTTNAGTTWQPLSDGQSTLAVGDLALEPGNPSVLYVGTGEGNVRNSVSFGRGVFKSTDGGATWRNVGLTDTRHIARVMVHPADRQTVYVCAVGHMAGPNAERGVFRSRDGGGTWTKVLYVDDRHGCADLDLDPVNPNIVYAAMWRFERKQWTFTSGSEQGGSLNRWTVAPRGRRWAVVFRRYWAVLG